MEPKTDQPEALESKTDAKPDIKADTKDDLKSLPMPELQAKLGSSPDGLSQDEAQKRLTQYGPNELTEKKTNLFLKFPYAHARPVLVHPPGKDFMDRGARHANRGDIDRGLWAVHDAPRLGLGRVCVGLHWCGSS